MKVIIPEKKLLNRTNNVDYYQWNYKFPIKYIQRYRFNSVAKLLGESIYPRLLEVGTGSGIFLPELARHCEKLYACDIHPHFDKIDDLLKYYNLSNYELKTQSIQNTDYPDNYFDAIVAVSVLEFVDDLEASISEIKRILKKEGVFITICPMHSKILDYFVSLYADKTAQEEFGDTRIFVGNALEQNFKVIKKGYMVPFIGKIFPVYTHFLLKKIDKEMEELKDKAFISLIVPCYNEEAILRINLDSIIEYMNSKNYKYSYEILIVDDGSKDGTGEIAEEFAKNNINIRVIHHPTNLNLGNALKTGIFNAKGDILVVLDIDLSYSVEHIERMVDKLIETSADIVVASPYMKGGQVTAVPFLREIMSKWVNRFMRIAAQEKYYTYTGMVRAYRSSFIRTVNLKTKDYEVNPEIMYKAMILRARIIEIPAHLDWTEQNKYAGKRTSSIRVLRGFFSGIMSGFIFRPYIFFVVIGALLMCLSLYQLVWLLVDTLSGMSGIDMQNALSENPFSASLALQFRKNPQSFIVGGITFLISIQFLSLGFLSLQSKRYFEELFHLGTALKKHIENDTKL